MSSISCYMSNAAQCSEAHWVQITPFPLETSWGKGPHWGLAALVPAATTMGIKPPCTQLFPPRKGAWSCGEGRMQCWRGGLCSCSTNPMGTTFWLRLEPVQV